MKNISVFILVLAMLLFYGVLMVLSLEAGFEAVQAKQNYINSILLQY